MKTLTLILFIWMIALSSVTFGKTAKEAKGLKTGSQAPYFEAINNQGESILLQSLLNDGPVVLIFYRGAWCPYCNRHLSEIQAELPKIYAKGAKIIAVTPEKPEFIDQMIENTGSKFTIVYDKDYKIAKAYDVNFTPKQSQINYANNSKNAKLSEAHNNEEINLPIPATYIISSSGKIIWRHFDPNFRKRASVDDILKHLPNN